MNNVRRRSFIKALASVPVIGGLGRFYLFGADSGARETVQSGENLRSINILRLLTTAQLRHWGKHGTYGSLSELSNGGFIDEVADNSYAEKKGFGRSLFSALRFQTAEVIPGWSLSHRLDKDALAFTTLIDGSANGFKSFAIDQGGVIFHGKSRQLTSTGIWQRASDVIVGEALGTRAPKKQPSALESLLKGFALGPETVYADPNCCPDGCCCNSSCSCGDFNPQAYACGCDSCPWCQNGCC